MFPFNRNPGQQPPLSQKIMKNSWQSSKAFRSFSRNKCRGPAQSLWWHGHSLGHTEKKSFVYIALWSKWYSATYGSPSEVFIDSKVLRFLQTNSFIFPFWLRCLIFCFFFLPTTIAKTSIIKLIRSGENSSLALMILGENVSIFSH